MILVSKANFNSVEAVAFAASGNPWPSGKLVVPPSNYVYDTTVVDMTREGLYFLSNNYVGGFDGGQCVVYLNDIPQLMASFAWLIRYGRQDEGRSFADLSNTARARSVGLRCGYATQWVIQWCAQLGITARTIRLLTANATPVINEPFVPWADGLDEGHVALEVLLPTGWALFDVPGNCAYLDASGKYLSLNEVISTGVDNCTVLDLAPTASYPTDWSSTNFATEVYHNIKLQHHSDKWRSGIYQIPGIDYTDGNTYFYLPSGTESRASWVSSLSPTYKQVTKSAWETMFYN